MRLNRDIGLTVLLAEQHLPFIRRVADRFCLLHVGVTWPRATLSSWMNRCWRSG
jgi:ABC-type branched-subunit amino acid transport system ATPase component